jgi:hypothetical protein
MKKHEISQQDIVENLANAGSEEWSKALSSRLELLRGYLSQDEWTKGIAIYLRAIQGTAMQKMLGEALSHDTNNYTRGLIAALQIVISLPKTIEAAIEMESKKTDRGPKGNAGY